MKLKCGSCKKLILIDEYEIREEGLMQNMHGFCEYCQADSIVYRVRASYENPWSNYAEAY